MKCKFCRNDVPDGAKICPTCGSVVEPENMSAAENQGEGIRMQKEQHLRRREILDISMARQIRE